MTEVAFGKTSWIHHLALRMSGAARVDQILQMRAERVRVEPGSTTDVPDWTSQRIRDRRRQAVAVVRIDSPSEGPIPQRVHAAILVSTDHVESTRHCLEKNDTEPLPR